MLILVATPIGNLEDFSHRAVESLKNCDYILCEDTRHSAHLLSKYSIRTQTKSYHQFNEAKSEETILSDLASGKTVCLISDAGTPGISDPGARLVSKCIEKNIKVSHIPGPCAAISALVCSGLDTSAFQFLGFLPKKEQAIKNILYKALTYSGTTIFYESPQRVLPFLAILQAIDPLRTVVIARELTKKFETFYCDSAINLFNSLKSLSLKGEVVILLKDNPLFQLNDWASLSPEEHVTLVQSTFTLSKMDAIKIVAHLRCSSKSALYNSL